MSKISGRLSREELKKERREKQRAEKELRGRSGSAPHSTLPNRKSDYNTVEAEIEGRLLCCNRSSGVFSGQAADFVETSFQNKRSGEI